MVPFSVRVPVNAADVFPMGALCMSVEPATDYDLRNTADDQVRDRDTGLRVWVVTVVDLEEPEDGSRFRRPTVELKVKVAAEVRPVPPPSRVRGMPPLVTFTGLAMSPWVDRSKCRPEPGAPCRSRLSYSLTATGIVAFDGDDGEEVTPLRAA